MERKKVSFFDEIRSMMIGFGDNLNPNNDTVLLIESIVLKQLRTIIQECIKYNDEKINGKELVFLMRRNKYNIRKFIQHLKNKATIQANLSKTNDIDTKPKNDLIEFIKYIDETGEYDDCNDFDEIRYERQLRLNRISIILDEKKYLQYSHARTKSFKNSRVNNFSKLKKWIDPTDSIHFDNAALEVLGFIAFETVACIVDFAFFVRMDSKGKNDPFKNLNNFYYSSTLSILKKSDDKEKERKKILAGWFPITVDEIKEVLRRLYTTQTGKLNFGKKLPETHFMFAL